MEYLGISAGALPQSHTQGTQFFSNHKLHSGPGDHLPVVFQTDTRDSRSPIQNSILAASALHSRIVFLQPSLPCTPGTATTMAYQLPLHACPPTWFIWTLTGCFSWPSQCGLCMLQTLLSLCMSTHQSQSVLPRRLFPACPATMDSL